MFNLRALAERIREKDPAIIGISLLVALLWGMHAAGPSIPPGRGYLRFGLLFPFRRVPLRKLSVVNDSARRAAIPQQHDVRIWTLLRQPGFQRRLQIRCAFQTKSVHTRETQRGVPQALQPTRSLSAPLAQCK